MKTGLQGSFEHDFLDAFYSFPVQANDAFSSQETLESQD